MRVPAPGDLVVLRHGESTANAAGTFTGWSDPRLTPEGREQARQARRHLTRCRMRLDVVHTSVLRRAVDTTAVVLGEMAPPHPAIAYSWRLNERHYGALTGRIKKEVRAEVGERVYQNWRNSLTEAPPPMSPTALAALRVDPRYAAAVPHTESLGDTLARMLPYWHAEIAPALRAGRNVLLVGHGNCLRVLIAHLHGLTPDELTALRIPPGTPKRYSLDHNQLRQYPEQVNPCTPVPDCPV